jgi:hypothetical protein
MEAQTQSDETEIEAVDISNDDMIEVLAELARFHDNPSTVDEPKLSLAGSGPRRMLFPIGEDDARPEPTISADQLVLGDGEVTGTVMIDGEAVDLEVL